MTDLRIIHIDIYPAQSIDGVCQPRKTNGNKVCDIQIQIHIQHVDRHLRTALRIRRITLVVGIVAQVQISITVYRHQPALSGILIDRSDHDRIASCILRQCTRRGVYTEQSYIPIAFHGSLLRLLNLRIDNDLVLIQIQLSALGTGQYGVQNEYRNDQYDNLYNKNNDSSALLLSLCFPAGSFLTGPLFAGRLLP